MNLQDKTDNHPHPSQKCHQLLVQVPGKVAITSKWVVGHFELGQAGQVVKGTFFNGLNRVPTQFESVQVVQALKHARVDHFQLVLREVQDFQAFQVAKSSFINVNNVVVLQVELLKKRQLLKQKGSGFIEEIGIVDLLLP